MRYDPKSTHSHPNPFRSVTIRLTTEIVRFTRNRPSRKR